MTGSSGSISRLFFLCFPLGLERQPVPDPGAGDLLVVEAPAVAQPGREPTRRHQRPPDHSAGPQVAQHLEQQVLKEAGNYKSWDFFLIDVFCPKTVH